MNELFYRFALEQDIIENGYYQGALDKAKSVFGALLAAQAEKVLRLQETAPTGNLSHYILKGYHNGEFHVVSSRKNLKNARDCLVEHDALCIRIETLRNYLCGQAANFHWLTEKNLSKKLREEGVLSDTQEKRAANKKINGKRFLELKFSALSKAAMQY